MEQLFFPREELDLLVRGIFEAAGVPAEHAAAVTGNLIAADMCGLPSHGLMRVKPYLQRIRAGLTDPRPVISHRQVGESLFQVDAGGALGQVAAEHALALCMDRAGKSGAAAAAVSHMNHLGMAGFYTRKAAQAGFLAFLCTNASPTMAPFGGLDCLLGTNPFSLSFDAGRHGVFTLDIATTAAARGKVRMYEKEGKPLPPGWALDDRGNDTTDPAKALEGSMLPMGAHKGYGLSMIVDVLSALLSGADLSYEAESMFQAGRPANTGCYMSLVDISRFVSRDEFLRRCEAWMDAVKSSRLRPGFSEILLPGEIEDRRLAEARDRVPLLDKTYQELRELADQAR